MKREHTSASSIENFSECPARWLSHYDEELRVSTRNDYSDAGNLVHRTMELWRDPESHFPQTYEGLELAFAQACQDEKIAESFAVYTRAKGLLASAFRMTTIHPTVPIHLAQIIAVEQPLVDLNGELWKMPSWPLPMKGSIDCVWIIPIPNGPPNEIILGAEDYKTARPQTHSELTQEKIQAPAYILYLRDIVVKHLEAQVCAENGKNYVVKKIVMAWDYIQDGSAVPMYESDFDHAVTQAYIANIATQQLTLVEKWNKVNEEVNDLGTSGYPEEAVALEIEFLEKYEKPNSYCAYCPRKGSCQTFSRLLEYKSVIDITDPNTSWDEIWADHDRFNAIKKDAEKRVDDINKLVPAYLDFEKKQSIVLANGMEIVANQQTREEYRVEAVREILGDEFVIRSAKITKTSIEKELALISKNDPEKAREKAAELKGAYTPTPGPRPVIARKIK